MVSGGQSRPREDCLQDVIVSRAVGYKTMYGTAQRADVGVAPGHTAGLQWQNTAKETGRVKRDRAEPPGEISPWTLVCSDSWAEPRCTSSSRLQRSRWLKSRVQAEAVCAWWLRVERVQRPPSSLISTAIQLLPAWKANLDKQVQCY